MFIQFFCLGPLGLTVKLNFNMSLVAYYTLNSTHEGTQEKTEYYM